MWVLPLVSGNPLALKGSPEGQGAVMPNGVPRPSELGVKANSVSAWELLSSQRRGFNSYHPRRCKSESTKYLASLGCGCGEEQEWCVCACVCVYVCVWWGHAEKERRCFLNPLSSVWRPYQQGLPSHLPSQTRIKIIS